jgi:hypothetical protein
MPASHSTRRRPEPPPADPLARLLASAAGDPATDERVRWWLSRLLDGDAAGGVPGTTEDAGALAPTTTFVSQDRG